MTERARLYGRGALGTFFVTASDGRVFRCWVQIVGQSNPHRRWIFEDHAERHFGPAFFHLDYLDELAEIVRDWWDTHKALGYEDITLASMRDRLVREIQREAADN